MKWRNRIYNNKITEQWLTVDTSSSTNLDNLLIESSFGIKFSYQINGNVHIVLYSPCCGTAMRYLDSEYFFCYGCSTKYLFAGEHNLFVASPFDEKLFLSGFPSKDKIVLFLAQWINQLTDPLTAVIETDYLTTLIEQAGLLSYETMTIKQRRRWMKEHSLITLDNYGIQYVS
jgi:hypothetical protein